MCSDNLFRYRLLCGKTTMLFILILVVSTLGAALPVPALRKRPMENKYLFEGDIVYFEDENYLRTSYAALVDDSKLWPKGVVYYRIAPALEASSSIILSAMKLIENRTCVRFVKRNEERGFVLIAKDQGCYSHIGWSGVGQPLSLGEGCMNQGTILHELMHTIGFYHEHNRSDRDDYIDIYWDNIDPEYDDEFDKYLPKENRLLNSFDYQSIMMYGPLAFSKDDVSPTMTPKKRGVELTEVHNKNYLTTSDIFRINQLYKC